MRKWNEERSRRRRIGKRNISRRKVKGRRRRQERGVQAEEEKDRERDGEVIRGSKGTEENVMGM